jgi:hypothetical protein
MTRRTVSSRAARLMAVVPVAGHASSSSEANTVITDFHDQSEANQQPRIVFLRSL